MPCQIYYSRISDEDSKKIQNRYHLIPYIGSSGIPYFPIKMLIHFLRVNRHIRKWDHGSFSIRESSPFNWRMVSSGVFFPPERRSDQIHAMIITGIPRIPTRILPLKNPTVVTSAPNKSKIQGPVWDGGLRPAMFFFTSSNCSSMGDGAFPFFPFIFFPFMRVRI